MKILITGVGGFIASNVAEWICSNSNHEVVGTYRNRKPRSKQFECIKFDLFQDPYEWIGKKYDVIIHFASQLYGEDIRTFLDNTVQATRNLLDFAEREGIQNFIYMSSISVCGETQGYLNEDSNQINLNNYEMTKLIGEYLLKNSKIEKKVIIRLPRVLGTGIDYSAPWLPKTSYSILKNEKVSYYNPDLKYNALIHTDSLSEFILDILNKTEIINDTFVLGAKDEMSILEILEFLRKELNSQSQFYEIEQGKANRCCMVDSSRAQKFGFKPDDMRNILRKYVKDMKIGMNDLRE